MHKLTVPMISRAIYNLENVLFKLDGNVDKIYTAVEELKSIRKEMMKDDKHKSTTK